MSDRGYVDPAEQYVGRLAGYDQRLQMLERSHEHEPNLPVGGIIDWPYPAIPPLWMIADGRLLLVAAYPDLFRWSNYLYGGSGAYFALPDVRSRTTVAAGQGLGLTTRPLGATGGAETVILTAGHNGPHDHGFNVTSVAGGQHDHGGTTHTDGGVHQHNGTTHTDGGVHVHQGTTNLLGGQHQHTYAHHPVSVNQAAYAEPPAAWTLGPVQEPFTSVAGNHGHPFTTEVSESHGHPFTTDGSVPHGHPFTTDGSVPHGHPFTTAASAEHAHLVNGRTDQGPSGGFGHENMPPWIGFYKIIKVLPSTAANTVALTIIERSH